MAKLPEEATTGAVEVRSDAQAVPVIRISLQAQVDGGRSPKSMSVETYVPQDIPLSEFNKVADTVSAVVRRQTAIYELANIADHIKHVEKEAELVQQQMAKIDARRKERAELQAGSGRRLSKEPENEEQNRRSLLEKLENVRQRVLVYREQQAEYEEVIRSGGIFNLSSNHKHSM